MLTEILRNKCVRRAVLNPSLVTPLGLLRLCGPAVQCKEGPGHPQPWGYRVGLGGFMGHPFPILGC